MPVGRNPETGSFIPDPKLIGLSVPEKARRRYIDKQIRDTRLKLEHLLREAYRYGRIDLLTDDEWKRLDKK